jgi:hypothetical protein
MVKLVSDEYFPYLKYFQKKNTPVGIFVCYNTLLFLIKALQVKYTILLTGNIAKLPVF